MYEIACLNINIFKQVVFYNILKGFEDFSAHFILFGVKSWYSRSKVLETHYKISRLHLTMVYGLSVKMS
jgi:hypothetical protein